MARAYGSNAALIGAFESTYGASPADGFTKLPFVSSTLGAEQPLVADDTLGNGRDPRAPSRDVVTVDGEIVIPLDVRNVGLWLKGAFGEPTTTGTGPYAHAFASGADGDDIPSLALEIGNPEVPSYRLAEGVRVNSITVPFATSGTVSATVNVIAQGETPGGTTADIAPTELAYSRFSAFQGSVKFNGSALGNVTGGELTYTNNLDPVRVIRDDGKIEGADPTVAACTGSITVRFADMALFNAATAGTPVALEFAYTADTGRKLVFTVPEVYLPRPRIPIQGPGGIEVTFNWQAAKPAAGNMLTAVLTNDVASY